ncbi:AAA family ATPase [Faecalibacterium sp. AF10-46]|uniref:AAA family ATPase n=1 Tax=Faecalibacterium sp. AF10-46 TaxID=2302955 RepID=UPI000E76AFF7|nr:AAA family ATPase [Faecalibacterium sp. AF10-46]RJW77907.1 AAA family ATPase [Faecalibacterium sp. AF10-46]
MKRSAENILASYIDALHPIIYINHFDFKVIDAAIAHVGQGAKYVEFNNALGLVDFKTKSPMKDCSLEEFLKLTMDDGFEQQTFLILKDVHRELDNPKVIAYMKRIAENNLYNENYSATIFIISEVTVIPRELENYITIFDIPLPTIDEIRGIIRAFITDMEIEVDADTIDEIALSFKGLNEFQIRQILTLAYQDGGCITRGDKALILKEKEQFIKKSGMLEIVNFSESIEDIGGLENLKDWLYRKAFIFRELDKAIKFGVDVPKGIMIIGMPGCGKSLTAKATASLFEIPLVRLDVGRLLGKYVGESEENMRNALKLSEAISPCVLWIDEIEKAFAGVGGEGGGNDVTTRLFGQFLTWMQEKENTVFIVATANDISRLPPEFLRKGRFDELFFVDLPNGTERRKILEIHLKKRKKWNENIDSIALIKETEGYNGADLEAVVKDTIERAFIEGRTTITTADLIRSIKDTKSISCTLKDKIASIQKTVEKIDIKPASLDDKKEKEPDPSQAYVKAAKAKAEPNPWRACAEAAKVIAEPGVRTAASVTSAKCGIYAKMFGELTKEQKGKQQ